MKFIEPNAQELSNVILQTNITWTNGILFLFYKNKEVIQFCPNYPIYGALWGMEEKTHARANRKELGFTGEMKQTNREDVTLNKESKLSYQAPRTPQFREKQEIQGKIEY
ncbi:hypothetical protein L2E82_02736 [Cichorium intybus]|uniref:Uncharacterized protein n=1 Tax=Cichorium intybus TaxID=13427 RepID=A0ACB9H2G3_CICIN|nr:hypothetical protein L2E82_02736 [Cichorium intybus]